MKMSSRRIRGSMLLATMISVMIIAVATGYLMEYVSNSYRNSMRQRKLFQVRSAAENEMEFVFYTWKQTLLNNAISTVSDTGMRTIPGLIANSTFTRGGNTYRFSDHEPFVPSMPDLGGTTSRPVTRDILFEPNERRTGVTNTTPAKTGQMSYFVAQSSIAYADPIFGVLNVNIGRRFIYSETSLFQYSVFYQGDIEFSGSGIISIAGDVSSNSNIYMGVKNDLVSSLTVKDKVRFAGTYNGNVDPTVGTQHTFDVSRSGTLLDPHFVDSRAAQVEKLNDVENFLGGIDVDTVINAFPAAYNTDGNPAISNAERNAIYRAVIAPPPTVAEDPTVSAHRMYNRAGLIIKVSTDGGGNPEIHAYTSNNGTLGTEVTSALKGAGVITDALTREIHYDYREGQKVKMTSVNVGSLKTLLQAGTSSDLNNSYNGFVYVYDTDAEHTDVGTPTNSYKAGVRLVNGADVPDLDSGLVKGGAATGETTGFTVATDNGLYVQGNYNTVPASVSGAVKTPRSAALLGDAVTVLSDAWTPAYNASTALGARLAVASPMDAANTFNDSNDYTTIVAAIVSGNTPTDGTNISGGVQNLVRYLENWNSPQESVKLLGSLGQLFSSVHYNSGYKNIPGSDPYAVNVYGPPKNRDLVFDDNLAKNPKGGWPSTTNFYRGDYFTW